MNLYNVKNIKDLPQLEQILPGNFMVVENFNGTNKLDFDDFVIGPRNTSFANQVFNDILSLSSYSVSLSSTVTSQVTSLSTSTFTSLSTLNSQIPYLSGLMSGNNNAGNSNARIGLIKMYKTTFTLLANSTIRTIGFALPTDIGLPLQNSDIQICPRNAYNVSLLYAWDITDVRVDAGNTTTYTVTLTTNTTDVGLDRSFDMTVSTI